MQGLQTAFKWTYRALLAIFWFDYLFLGYQFPSRDTGMNWLIDFETWLINHARDPILVAFMGGLTFGTWIIPDIWKVLKKIALRTTDSNIVLEHDDQCMETLTIGGHLFECHFLRVKNSSTKNLRHCQTRVTLTTHGSFTPPARWPVYINEPFDLKPLDKSHTVFILFTKFDEHGPIEVYGLHLQGGRWIKSPQPIQFLAVGCPYEISIEVVSEDTTPASIALRITYENEKWKVWKAGANSA
jgi:hypothetical protein